MLFQVLGGSAAPGQLGSKRKSSAEGELVEGNKWQQHVGVLVCCDIFFEEDVGTEFDLKSAKQKFLSLNIM